ncbi:MAG: hypothetical protein HWN66_05845 [Candidatus Helarchaeota archaeon]|nr:hypothetical protein [Candidatus Helarchaeota archaeon]
MQVNYIRIVRKVKGKSDGESAIAKDVVRKAIEKFLLKFSEAPGIIEASRKLYSTAIKTYKVPNTMIAETAKEGAELLFEKFGKAAAGEISLVYSSAIIHYFSLKEEALAKSLADDASAFFTKCDCSEQIAKISEVLQDPRSKSDAKLF